MEFLLASNNTEKIAEMRRILEPLGIEILTPRDLGINVDVEENGSTFMENAEIKAKAFYEVAGIPVIADDSGMCIDNLGGRPGVETARYGGEIPYSDKMSMILKELAGTTWFNRTASFNCAIYCIIDKDNTISANGECRGYIGFNPIGEGGFGYDPIFMVENESFATMPAQKKDEISHRGQALRTFVTKLKFYLGIEERENKAEPAIN